MANSICSDYSLEIAQVTDRTIAPIGDVTENEMISGVYEFNDSGFGGKNYAGIEYSEFSGESYFNRIWFSPTSHAAGFISENTDIDVVIWNSYPLATKSITAFVGTGTDGTNPDAIVLPKNIGPLRDFTHTIALLAEGPAKQQTTYSYTIAGDVYEIEITGLRIEEFPFLNNWGAGVTMEMAFLTAISQSKWTFSEQRRALMGVLFRTQIVEYLRQGSEADGILNCLQGLGNKMIAVPIYCEPMLPASDFSGDSEIELMEDPENYWNLNEQCEYLCLLDTATNLVEVKELSGISGTTLTLANAVMGTFDYQTTIVFPAFLGKLREIEPSWLTDGTLRITATWEEYEYGG